MDLHAVLPAVLGSVLILIASKLLWKLKTHRQRFQLLVCLCSFPLAFPTRPYLISNRLNVLVSHCSLTLSVSSCA